LLVFESIFSLLDEFHGKNGEVVLEPASYSPLAKYFVRAAEELGYPIIDTNAPYEQGI